MCDIKRKTLQQVFEDYFLPRIKETIFCDLKKNRGIFAYV